MQKQHDIIKCYYRPTDLTQYQNLQETILFGSTLFNDPIGNGFYILSLYQLFKQNQKNIFDIENGVYYFDDPNDLRKKHCIYFIFSAYDSSINDTLNPNTDLTFQILGGSGKYLGATGTINFITDTNNVRHITLDIFY